MPGWKYISTTRAQSSKNIAQILQSPGIPKDELIIGHVGPGELQQLATAAAQMNVPFIQCHFPNDGGIPNIQFVTSTAHANALRRHLSVHTA